MPKTGAKKATKSRTRVTTHVKVSKMKSGSPQARAMGERHRREMRARTVDSPGWTSLSAGQRDREQDRIFKQQRAEINKAETEGVASMRTRTRSVGGGGAAGAKRASRGTAKSGTGGTGGTGRRTYRRNLLGQFS